MTQPGRPVVGAAGPPGLVRVVASTAAATTAGVLPAFLLGSQAVQLERDLDFSPALLGVAIAVSWGAAAAGSAPLGRFTERRGGGRSLRLAALVSAAVQVSIAVVVRSWPLLVVLVAFGGIANALTQPAANLLMARTLPPERHGLGFGIKQSAVPMGTLLGGLAVPTLTLTLGWRATFAAGAVLAATAAVAVPTRSDRAPVLDASEDPAHAPAASAPDDGAVSDAGRLRGRRRTVLVVLASGVGLGAAAAGALSSFLVSGGVEAGLGEGVAGLALTLGSACGIAVRLLLGHRADRQTRQRPETVGRAGSVVQLRVVATMMLCGSVAFAAYALGTGWVFIVATPLAFGAGWAWPGLFNLSVVRAYPDQPGAATGITQSGTYLGAGLGPLGFGVVVEHAGFAPAWLLAALVLVAGAAMMMVGRSRLQPEPASTA